MSLSKKSLLLGLAALLFGTGSASADFTCRLTLAKSGDAPMQTSGVIRMRGNTGERVNGTDQGTGFRYQIEVLSGRRMECRGNRRQVVVSLYERGDRKRFIASSTCFEPNVDFLVNSSAENHWIYFNCYSGR